MTKDEIHIVGLELPVLIGVPEEERAAWQMLSADIILTLWRGFDTMKDQITETVDYDAATREIKALAAERPRQLLETLSSEIIAHLLQKEAIAQASVTLRKRILPGTDYVAVQMTRAREDC